jgi:hypothetical protein
MTKDAITGIRIGGTTYQEGRTYRAFAVPEFLQNTQLSRAARVVLDITGRQLTITVANRQGTLVGQLAVRGRAQVGGAAAGIASDFQVERVVEASQTLGGSGSQLSLAQATARQRFSFNAAYRRATNGSGPLSGDRWRSLAVSQRNSTGAITFTRRELKPQLGPFAEAFAGEWWAPVV